MASLQVQGDGLDTWAMTWEEWFADMDPRMEKLEPKLLPGCEKRD